MSVFTESPAYDVVDASKRVNWALGMLVGDDEMRQDQRYLMHRDEWHHRALHGFGVVAGLELAFDDAGRLEVRPGVAVDGQGRTVCVPVTYCASTSTMLDWMNDRAADVKAKRVDGEVTLHVLLCHAECPTDLVPVQSGPCQSLDDSLHASRLDDSFELRFALEAPTAGELSTVSDDENLQALMDRLDEAAAKGEPIDGLRAEVDAWVRDRILLDGFDGPCLGGVDACVPLGRLTVAVGGDGPFTFTTAPAAAGLDSSGRPVVVSTQLLHEWLLRVAGGSGVSLALDDLVDVDVAGVADGQVLQHEAGTWVAGDLPEPPDPGGGTPSGPAGGDLTGSYPDPQVDGLLGTELVDTRIGEEYASVGWNPTDRRWDVQTDVSAPRGPYAVVAAGAFRGSREFVRESYNKLEIVDVRRDRFGHVYRLIFPQYSDIIRRELAILIQLTAQTLEGQPPVVVELGALEPDFFEVRVSPLAPLFRVDPVEPPDTVVHVEVCIYGDIAPVIDDIRRSR